MNNNANDPTSSRSMSDSAKRRGRQKTVPQKVAPGSIGSPGLLLVKSRSNGRDNDDDQGGGELSKKKETSSGEPGSNNSETKKSSSDKWKKKKNNENMNKKKPLRSSTIHTSSIVTRWNRSSTHNLNETKKERIGRDLKSI
jgi:hypothetical protein